MICRNPRFLLCLAVGCLLGCAKDKFPKPPPPLPTAESTAGVVTEMDLNHARRLAKISTEVAGLPKGTLAKLIRKEVGSKKPTPEELKLVRIKLPSGIVTTLGEIDEAAAFVGSHVSD